MDLIIALVFCIFVVLLLLYLRFKPSIHCVYGKYLLWYTVEGKTGDYTTREFIILF
jgi:hypothetical protein